MTVFNNDLLISLTVTQFEHLKDVVKVVRSYSSRSMGEISSALKDGNAVFEILLVKTEFYNGWKNLYELAKELRDIKVSFVVSVNNQDVELKFLNELKKKATNIKREDIY